MGTVGATRRAAGVVAVAVAGMLAGAGVAHAARPGSSDTDAAVRALRRQYGYVNTRQFDLEYRELHPAQQALLTSDEWVACAEDLAPDGATLEVGDIRKVYRSTGEVPGTGVRARSVAITFEYETRNGSRSEGTRTTTSREVKVRGHWRWFLRAGVFRDCLDQAEAAS